MSKIRFLFPFRLALGVLVAALPLFSTPLLAKASPKATPENTARPTRAESVDSDGDLIPDAYDPLPLVANVPVYWSVQRFALSRPAPTKPADSSWENAPALNIAVILPAPKVNSSLSVMPRAARKATGPFNGHPFTLLAPFGSSSIRFGDLQRARTEAFLRGWRKTGANQPVTLAFTVHFVNLAAHNRSFTGLEVPVVLNGKVWTMARVLSKNPAAGREGLFLPADGQVRSQEFIAEIDASRANSFLASLASSDSSPVFDFPNAAGLDSAADSADFEKGVYSLSAAMHSILEKTRQICVLGPNDLQWNWRVAPVSRTTGESITFGLWADGMNDLSGKIYRAPLFAFDGAYPISIAGWDNGCWDFYWEAFQNGRPMDPARLLETRLDENIALELGRQPPRALPAEGKSAIVTHLRGVWFWNNGMVDSALGCFSMAGRDGAPQGYSWYGRCLALQPSSPKRADTNLVDATGFYKLAADQDYAPGLAWYGRAILRGRGRGGNKVAGAEALRQAAAQGFAEGRVLHALCLEKGIGVATNSAEARKSILRAAWQGSRVAQYALGVMLLEAQSPEGRDWLELAARAGDEKAAARLSRLLRNGELDIPADPTAALKWLRVAADLGNAPSLVTLGEAYRSGMGVSRNAEKAADCFRRAAEAGNNDGRTWYALCLLEGTGVRHDVSRGLELLTAAADGGHAGAQYFLGVCRFGGFGGSEPDPAEAMRRFQAAAKQQPAANVFLGVGYLNGFGIEKSDAKAFECFKAAAEQDLPAGQLWFAHCHANGIGVPRNPEEARKWAKKVADRGIPAGKQMLLAIQE